MKTRSVAQQPASLSNLGSAWGSRPTGLVTNICLFLSPIAMLQKLFFLS
jgi:hypothetical protein